MRPNSLINRSVSCERSNVLDFKVIKLYTHITKQKLKICIKIFPEVSFQASLHKLHTRLEISSPIRQVKST